CSIFNVLALPAPAGQLCYSNIEATFCQHFSAKYFDVNYGKNQGHFYASCINDFLLAENSLCKGGFLW
ncbi:MAG TPA: hypothetical protein PLD48_00750, partial [Bacillota bacterium]|nr:hypothetical protein [Bacillota bacterium]HPP85676.1 hypothetical protein [Bacillota bacterium]